MSNIDKRELREAAERATESDWIVDSHEGWHAVIPVADAVNGNYIIAEFQGPESKRNCDFVAAANPATVLALLDELEAAEERYEDMLRQARSFREAHDSASELIRTMERNKLTVKLPTTRLWAGKIACYEESEVVAMLERAGINIAAAGKGK